MAASAPSSSDRAVLVTVGSTKFEALISAATQPAVLSLLAQQGFTRLVLQTGRGEYDKPEEKDIPQSLVVEQFDFAPSLAHHFASAALVISHAGSGSIFEALRAGKQLVVVVNESLMDNHQRELADELARDSYLLCATPDSLLSVLYELPQQQLQPYPPADPSAFSRSVDSFLGFS